MLTFLITFYEWGGYFSDRNFAFSDGGWLFRTVFNFLGGGRGILTKKKCNRHCICNFLFSYPMKYLLKIIHIVSVQPLRFF